MEWVAFLNSFLSNVPNTLAIWVFSVPLHLEFGKLVMCFYSSESTKRFHFVYLRQISMVTEKYTCFQPDITTGNILLPDKLKLSTLAAHTTPVFPSDISLLIKKTDIHEYSLHFVDLPI